MKLKLFIPTTSIAGGLFMLKRTIKKRASAGRLLFLCAICFWPYATMGWEVEHMTVNINRDKCVGCGLCVNDCPAHILALEEDKAVQKSKGCIFCGHCVAVCPVQAVSLPALNRAPNKSWPPRPCRTMSPILFTG